MSGQAPFGSHLCGGRWPAWFFIGNPNMSVVAGLHTGGTSVSSGNGLCIHKEHKPGPWLSEASWSHAEEPFTLLLARSPHPHTSLGIPKPRASLAYLLRARLLRSEDKGASWMQQARPGQAYALLSPLPLATASCLPWCLVPSVPVLLDSRARRSCFPQCRPHSSLSVHTPCRLSTLGSGKPRSLKVEFVFFCIYSWFEINYLRWRYRCFYSVILQLPFIKKKKNPLLVVSQTCTPPKCPGVKKQAWGSCPLWSPSPQPWTLVAPLFSFLDLSKEGGTANGLSALCVPTKEVWEVVCFPLSKGD